LGLNVETKYRFPILKREGEFMPEQSQHIDGMKEALAEAHTDVRSYDTKAQIMGIGFIFSLGVIFNILEGFGTGQPLGWFKLLSAFVLSIGPVVLYGAVLYPSRRLFKSIQSRELGIQNTYYHVPGKSPSVEGYLAAARATHWEHEIAFEIVKVSRLRDVKRRRFIRALEASAVSFAILMGASLINLAGLHL
jgi:hypothetical protein